MALKRNKGKNKDKGQKKERSAESEQKLHRGNQLREIIQNVEGKNRHQEETVQEVLHPLTRCTSQPIVHEEALRKSLFWDDSKSVDFGFEPNPQIPKPIVLEEYPDDELQAFKDIKPPDRIRQLSFMANSKPDKSDKELLEATKKTSSKDFLRNRVGRKNMNAIMKHLKLEVEYHPDEPLSTTPASPSVVRNRRIMWIIVLVILISAIAVAVTMMLLTHQPEIVIPTTAPWFPTLRPAAVPFVYLPPAKVYNTIGGSIQFDLSCTYDPTRTYNPSQMSFLVIYAFLERGMHLGNGYARNTREETKGHFTTRYTSVWNYRNILPACLWYGMDFIDTSLSFYGQYHILIEEVVLPRFKEMYQMNCTSDLSSMQGSYDVILRVGEFYQNSITPERPTYMNVPVPLELQDIVRRKYPELKALNPNLRNT